VLLKSKASSTSLLRPTPPSPEQHERMSTTQIALDRINAVLNAAGLDDTIFSLRDANSSLFLLLFKKLFARTLPGVQAAPVGEQEHAANYEVLLRAIGDDVLGMDLSHLSPTQLAAGELAPLCNLAEIFSELCGILLADEDALPPHHHSSPDEGRLEDGGYGGGHGGGCGGGCGGGYSDMGCERGYGGHRDASYGGGCCGHETSAAREGLSMASSFSSSAAAAASVASASARPATAPPRKALSAAEVRRSAAAPAWRGDGVRRPHLGRASAAPRPHLGRTSAAPRLHLGCTSAAPRLHRGWFPLPAARAAVVVAPAWRGDVAAAARRRPSAARGDGRAREAEEERPLHFKTPSALLQQLQEEPRSSHSLERSSS